jgi:type I restriction enzyme S subunit
LNNGGDAEELRTHAQFFIGHLPRLTKRPDQIKQLRQTILDLAVSGKLVNHTSKNETVAELIKQIKKEKKQLIAEGKISKEKLPIPATPEELAFKLKPYWRATRMSEVLLELQTGPFGSSLHQSDYQMCGTPVINPASIKNQKLIPIDKMAVGEATLERLASFKLRKGDIVMACRGEMGRCAVVTDQEDGWLCGTGSLILRLSSFVSARFFVLLIGSPFVREYLGGSAVGATMQNLNQSILLNLVVGLPPLAEQHCIVAKVDELMTLCDQLEASLNTAQTETSRLLESVLHHALEASA